MKSLAVFLIFLSLVSCAKKSTKISLTEIVDHKDFKKLLRTKTNVLVFYTNKNTNLVGILEKVAEKVKGSGTVASINCGQDGKKLCKKLKINLENNEYILKHYKDGEFHKDFDRLETVESLTTFMKDPKGNFLLFLSS